MALHGASPLPPEDAVQEVLVRLVTHLSSFEGRSRFTTWAYTVAVRQPMRTSRRAAEASVAGPEAFAVFLDQHPDDPHRRPENQGYTIRTAVAELDLAVACSQAYRTDPRFGAPELVWSRLAAAVPTLLQVGADSGDGSAEGAP